MISPELSARCASFARRHRPALWAMVLLCGWLAVRLELPKLQQELATAFQLPWLAPEPTEPPEKLHVFQRILDERPPHVSVLLFGTFFGLGVMSLAGAELAAGRLIYERTAPAAVWGLGVPLLGLLALYGIEPVAHWTYAQLVPSYDPEEPTVEVQLACSTLAGLAVLGLAWRASRTSGMLGAPQPRGTLWSMPLILLVSYAFPLALFGVGALVFSARGALIGAQNVTEVMASSSGLTLALIIGYVVVCAPVFEEVLFRGLVAGALERRYSAAVTAGASAAVFGAMHEPATMLPAFGVGYLLALVRQRSGGLTAPIALHASFNMLMVVLTVIAALNREPKVEPTPSPPAVELPEQR